MHKTLHSFISVNHNPTTKWSLHPSKFKPKNNYSQIGL